MKKFIKSILLLSLLFSLISCGSKPAPEEETPSAPEVTQEINESAAETEVQSESSAEDEAAKKAAEEEAARKAAEEAAAAEAERLAKLAEAKKVALEAFENARQMRKKIDENNLSEYDLNNYNEGCANLQLLEDAFNTSGDLDESLFEIADKAYKNFNAVIFTAYKTLSKEERAAAYEAKKNADSVKAGVARKDDYTVAAEAFKKGDTLYAMQSPEKAYENYKLAKEQFTTLFNEVSEKRAAAAAALEAAKKRVQESAQFADEADVKAPITDEEVEGIEDENAILLEEDEYENPEEAEADIPESIDDQIVEVETEVETEIETEEISEVEENTETEEIEEEAE